MKETLTIEQDKIVAPKASKPKLYWELAKPRLTWLVVFSGAFGFLLASKGDIEWGKLLSLVVGSFMITSAANTINQIIEKELDKKMKRTCNRPLPSGALTVNEAIIFTLIMSVVGTFILWFFVNGIAAWLSLLSLLLYAFVYTPMKQISPISVLIGAFPGAFPPMIGWAAMTGEVSTEALILFGIQFFWQFPHFWAIAWIGDTEYRKAGFKMLPYKEKNETTVIQIIIYTLILLPLGVMPAQYGITGIASAFVAILAALGILWQAYGLLKDRSDKAALRIMFASIIYLPVVMIAFLVDKI
ncbi:heme o synthase [Limibacter armeniacum]|uniref:heme o synthase n=1 Tax=Limibacter armeniacum TaxID=466084 RepID=UPI0038CC0FD0